MGDIDVKLRKFASTCGIANESLSKNVLFAVAQLAENKSETTWGGLLGEFSTLAKQTNYLWVDTEPIFGQRVVAPRVKPDTPAGTTNPALKSVPELLSTMLTSEEQLKILPSCSVDDSKDTATIEAIKQHNLAIESDLKYFTLLADKCRSKGTKRKQ